MGSAHRRDRASGGVCEYWSDAAGIGADRCIALFHHPRCGHIRDRADTYFVAQRHAPWYLGYSCLGRNGFWGHVAVGTPDRLRAAYTFELAIHLSRIGTGSGNLGRLGMET